MGKASSRKNVAKLQASNTNEGAVVVSFVFDGKLYTNRHQLTASEMKHMKDLCVEFGDSAADQMLWKVAIRGTGLVAENIMAKAALDYIKKHYKGPVAVPGEPTVPVIVNESGRLELNDANN